MDRFINNLIWSWRSKINPSLLLFTGIFYTITSRVMVSSAEIEYEQSSKGHGSDMLHTTARLSPHVQHKTRPAYPSEALTCCCASPGASSAADVMQVPLL